MAFSQAQQWQTQQPGLQPAMLPNGGNRNAKSLAMGPAGRAWSYGLCECFGDPGTCFFAWCCPCIVYGKVKRRFEHLNSMGYPLQVGGCCNSDCMLFCCACGCCGCEFLMQMTQRGAIRSRYKIEGGGCYDFCASFWCRPCDLTQQSRELELEEQSFSGGKSG